MGLIVAGSISFAIIYGTHESEVIAQECPVVERPVWECPVPILTVQQSLECIERFGESDG